MKADRWHDPIYHTTYVLLTCKREEIAPWFKSTLGIEWEVGDATGVWATTFSHCSERNGSVQVFWFPPSPHSRNTDLPGIVSTISHEALHAVTSVLTNKGLPLSVEGDEAYAYYLGWVVEEVTSRLLTRPTWKKALTLRGKRT